MLFIAMLHGIPAINFGIVNGRPWLPRVGCLRLPKPNLGLFRVLKLSDLYISMHRGTKTNASLPVALCFTILHLRKPPTILKWLE